MDWSSSPTAKIALSCAGQQPQPAVLQPVGVLELVHQDVAEARPVMVAQRLVAAPAARSSAAAAPRNPPRPRCCTARRRRHRCSFMRRVNSSCASTCGARSPSSLVAADEPLHLAGREALLVHVEALQQPLDERELVLRVEDLEQLRQPRLAVVRAQQAVAQAMEGADPHAAGIDRQHRRDARQHFLRRLVGEGDRDADPCGLTCPVWISHATRVVSTRVLPLPAPARISADWCGSVTASSCCSLRPERKSGDMIGVKAHADYRVHKFTPPAGLDGLNCSRCDCSLDPGSSEQENGGRPAVFFAAIIAALFVDFNAAEIQSARHRARGPAGTGTRAARSAPGRRPANPSTTASRCSPTPPGSSTWGTCATTPSATSSPATTG